MATLHPEHVSKAAQASRRFSGSTSSQKRRMSTFVETEGVFGPPRTVSGSSIMNGFWPVPCLASFRAWRLREGSMSSHNGPRSDLLPLKRSLPCPVTCYLGRPELSYCLSCCANFDVSPSLREVSQTSWNAHRPSGVVMP